MTTLPTIVLILTAVVLALSVIASMTGVLWWLLGVRVEQTIRAEMRNSDGQPLPERVEVVRREVRRFSNLLAIHEHDDDGKVVADILPSEGGD